MTKKQKKTLELYIHIPFCARKCLYCDFLSFRTLAAVHETYVEQLIREIEAEGASCQEYQVVTVFIGGGTPSVLEPELIRDVCLAVRRAFDVAQDAEITIEVNPGTLLQNKLHIYRAAGINRVSIGLQSADNRELENLGRIHSFEEFLKSFQCARMAGFANINVDLMSGIPGQTLESWRNTLKKVTMLKPEHISAYSLIIEPGTPFWDRYGAGIEKTAAKSAPQPGTCPGEAPDRFGLRRRDYPELPDEEEENRIYHLTRTFLAEQGYERYEISNYARDGYECRHNVGYWIRRDYLGFGIGAASLIDNVRFQNEKSLGAYLAHPLESREEEQTLTVQDRMEETMFLGLRLTRGVSCVDFAEQYGRTVEEVYGEVIARNVADGLLTVTERKENQKKDRFLALTKRGLDLSNYVMAQFLF